MVAVGDCVEARQKGVVLKLASTFLWMRRIDGWALFAFACGVTLLFGYGQQRMLGVAMGLAFVVGYMTRPAKTMRRLVPVPREILLYTAWVAWAGCTGIFLVSDSMSFTSRYSVVLQVLAMVWIVYAILRILRNVDVVFLALLTGAVVQIVLIVLGVAGQRSGLVMDPSERLTGGLRNPNGLAFLMVWGALSALMFWPVGKRRALAVKSTILSVVFVTTYVLLATGSRKSTIAMGFLVYGWAIFARGKARGMKKIVSSAIVGSVALVVLVSFGPGLVENTASARRFEMFVDEGGGDLGKAARANIRYDMYADGLEIFFEYPIFGVGLSNFGAYFRTGQYSHSDIMEPLATTGLFGFILYQSFYLLLIARVWRLLKCAGNDSTRYRLRMILLGVLTILVLGLGTPHYTSAPVFLLLTAFSVSTTEMDGWVGGGRAPAGQQIRWYGDTGLVARRPVTRVFPKGGNW